MCRELTEINSVACYNIATFARNIFIWNINLNK